MARARHKYGEEGGINMTPMIDVVFQLIIFFVVTIKMDQDKFTEKIRLAMSPHGPKLADTQDPRTVWIEVDEKGRIIIARIPLSQTQLRAWMQGAVNRYGFGIPVIIRADLSSRHDEVRKVMDVCSSVGLWRIQFAAIKQKAPGSK